MKPFKKGEMITPERMKKFEKSEGGGIPGETFIDLFDRLFGRVFSKTGKYLKDNW